MFFPFLCPVQPAPVVPMDVHQRWLSKCYDPWERSPHSFYLLGLYICLREMSGLVCACMCLSVFFSTYCCLSLERITHRHSAVKSSFPPSPNKLWRWSVLSDRQQLTAQSRQWRYYRPKNVAFYDLQREIFVNLYSIFSVSLLQLTQCWSKWLSWLGSGQ